MKTKVYRKGCINKKCENFKKKNLLVEEVNYCQICGNKTEYVCSHPGCFKKLDEKSTYCQTHKAEHRGKVAKVAAAVGGTAVAIASVVPLVVRNVIKK